MSEPSVRFDSRFSDPAAEATPWEATRAVLERAELYWLTTVRADGRPHVTPLIGVHHEGAVHFVTGTGEQKFRNLGHSHKVALTTGTNTWAAGLDVVVEGEAVRVTDTEELQPIADAIEAKYGRSGISTWRATPSAVRARTRATSSGSSRPRCSRSPRSRMRRRATGSASAARVLTGETSAHDG